MKKQLIYLLAAFSILVVSCQKELSFEGSNSPAAGSLQDDVTGDCLPKTVNGNYLTGTALIPATNTIAVQVNVTKTGSYLVYTDTLNGFFFRATGTFTTLGANNVTLRGFGTPLTAIPTNFVVHFDTTVCDIQVMVTAPIPPGAGDLAGSPNACAPITVNGGYSPGVALTSGNNAVVQVNVTTAGSFNITTDTVAGVWFTFSGPLAISPPPQNVTLQAQGAITAGTPSGPKTFKVKLGTSQCTFDVQVTGPAAFTIDCPNVVVSGVYQVGVQLNPAFHTIYLPISGVTPGAYSITASVNGMTFTGSGTLTAMSGSITLTGVNTTSPTAAGTFNLSVGTPACLIPITVVAAPVINWKFNIGANLYQGSSSTAPGDIGYDVSLPPFSLLYYIGVNAALDQIEFDLLDVLGGITATETYNSDAAPFSQASDFYFTDGPGTLDLEAAFGTNGGAKITFRITSHSTATKTIIGTFDGTAWDYLSSTLKTITAGQFTVVYP